MSAPSFDERSVVEIERTLGREPRDRRIVPCEAEEAWSPEWLRNLSEHALSILARAADIVVFFDEQGRAIGWRDEGRRGAAQPKWIHRDLLLEIIIAELELPAGTRLGELRPRELPPLGWTLEAVLILGGDAVRSDTLRAWVDPEGMCVVQCLSGNPMEAKQ